MGRLTDRHDVIGPLVAIRYRRGMTQQQVGDRMGVSRAAVSLIESGGRNNEIDTLMRYAHAVGAKITVTEVSP